ncbi:MAG: HAMP domain-containing sensor histidine kinase [Pseudomonadota bacterium]
MIGEPGLPPVRGLIDGDGRLVEADPRLEDLNARAGGVVGAALAVPQLATLARLARRLRILVSRAVRVADGDEDLDLWVRAEPDGAAVRLAITGWSFRNAWEPAPGLDEHLPGDGWRWESDAALRLTYLAEDAAARFGIDAATMLGQPLTRVFALTEAADGSLPILAAVAAQARFEGQRATLRGTNRAVTLAAVPRSDAQGRFAGFVGSAEIEVAALRAPPPTTLPEAFSTRLDKALRAPLGRIVANADSINAASEGPLRPEYADYASDIATAGRHLIGLVDDLVDLQYIERDGFSVAEEEIDLADIARRAAGLLAVRADSEDVRIDKPSADDRLPATGEFRRALQVLVNLIGNAVRYSPSGGMVWIRIEREGPVAAVIVADQGKGIATDDQGRIFEKFERVDPTEPGGSGLGLYIARRLARAMGGDIQVDSAPGQGARFIFTLPAL